jgi:hypothetical protein
MNYETSLEIEIAVAGWFDYSKYVIVPNLHMYGDYECDLVLLSKLGYLYEVEIKVSRSDLIRDKKKRKWGWSYMMHKTRKMWFAIPEILENAIAHIPEQAGVLSVNKFGYVTEVRKSKIDSKARKLSDRDQFKVARLGAMRIWKLKKALLK